MAQTITLKQNNIVVLACTASQTIGSNPVIAAVLSNGDTISLPVVVTDSLHFNVTINTGLLDLRLCPMDIKIGNVSSDTIYLDIVKSIA